MRNFWLDRKGRLEWSVTNPLHEPGIEQHNLWFMRGAAPMVYIGWVKKSADGEITYMTMKLAIVALSHYSLEETKGLLEREAAFVE